MNRPEHTEDDSGLDAPPGLKTALGALHRSSVCVPPAVDDAIRRAAREHLTSQPGRRVGEMRTRESGSWAETLASWSRPFLERYWRTTTQRIGAAAAVAFGLWLAWFTLTPKPWSPAEDFNRDGAVDILDAFALARAVEQSAPLATRFDLNQDGFINRTDADRIARQAVLLERKGSW